MVYRVCRDPPERNACANNQIHGCDASLTPIAFVIEQNLDIDSPTLRVHQPAHDRRRCERVARQPDGLACAADNFEHQRFGTSLGSKRNFN